jgi:hypothetical protein
MVPLLPVDVRLMEAPFTVAPTSVRAEAAVSVTKRMFTVKVTPEREDVVPTTRRVESVVPLMDPPVISTLVIVRSAAAPMLIFRPSGIVVPERERAFSTTSVPRPLSVRELIVVPELSTVEPAWIVTVIEEVIVVDDKELVLAPVKRRKEEVPVELNVELDIVPFINARVIVLLIVVLAERTTPFRVLLPVTVKMFPMVVMPIEPPNIVTPARFKVVLAAVSTKLRG